MGVHVLNCDAPRPAAGPHFPRISRRRLLLLALPWWCVIIAAAETAPGPRPRGDPLVFVVHRSNPADNLSIADLRKLFRGERRKWPHGRNVTVAMRNPGAPERAVVLREIYEMDESEFARFLLQGEFTGDLSSPPKQLNSADYVIRFVFNVPGAIGYVRLSELNASVKPLRIGGIAPGDPSYPLLAPPAAEAEENAPRPAQR